MINLGVKVFIGLTVLFKSFGGPFIWKLTPNIPSPVLLPTKILPSSGILAIFLLIVVNVVHASVRLNAVDNNDEYQSTNTTKIEEYVTEPFWYRLTYALFWHPMKGIVHSASIFMVVAVSAERFRAVCYPFSRKHVSKSINPLILPHTKQACNSHFITYNTCNLINIL